MGQGGVDVAVDRQLISALWGLGTLARERALEPRGMLQRIHLITLEDQERLAQWVRTIQWAVMYLLDIESLDAESWDLVFGPYQQETGRKLSFAGPPATA
jgi:hypothetical protein